MIIHNHEDELVMHANRDEAVELVKAISGALSSNPEGQNFTISLGPYTHGPHHVDDDIQAETQAED